MLPVLAAAGEGIRKSESGDIITLLATLTGAPELPAASGRADLKAWKADFKDCFSKLTRPRLLKLPLLSQPGWDYGTPEDSGYARSKYEGQGFDYAEAEAQTAELLQQMNGHLEAFAALMQTDTAVTATPGGGFSWDDLIYMPDLRTLTCVAGLRWPAKVNGYLEHGLAKGGVDSYAAEAI